MGRRACGMMTGSQVLDAQDTLHKPTSTSIVSPPNF